MRPYLRLVSDSELTKGCEAELLFAIKSTAGFTPAGTVAKVLNLHHGDWVTVSVYVSPVAGGRGAKRVVIVQRSELRRIDTVTRRAA